MNYLGHAWDIQNGVKVETNKGASTRVKIEEIVKKRFAPGKRKRLEGNRK